VRGHWSCIRSRKELRTRVSLDPGVHAADCRDVRYVEPQVNVLLTDCQVFGRRERESTFVAKGGDIFVVGRLEFRVDGLRHDI